jgi:hypothetical protein
MAILSNTWGVECIRSSPNTDNQVIIIHRKFTISINVCPNIWSAVDLFVCWINPEALCFPKPERAISLQNDIQKSEYNKYTTKHNKMTIINKFHNLEYIPY